MGGNSSSYRRDDLIFDLTDTKQSIWKTAVATKKYPVKLLAVQSVTVLTI